MARARFIAIYGVSLAMGWGRLCDTPAISSFRLSCEAFVVGMSPFTTCPGQPCRRELEVYRKLVSLRAQLHQLGSGISKLHSCSLDFRLLRALRKAREPKYPGKSGREA